MTRSSIFIRAGNISFYEKGSDYNVNYQRQNYVVEV